MMKITRHDAGERERKGQVHACVWLIENTFMASLGEASDCRENL